MEIPLLKPDAKEQSLNACEACGGHRKERKHAINPPVNLTEEEKVEQEAAGGSTAAAIDWDLVGIYQEKQKSLNYGLSYLAQERMTGRHWDLGQFNFDEKRREQRLDPYRV
ncbi:hypothetical protein E5288_WYG009048 [Bos mutus]|uniref:Uncharacterized protein n=1 Tax=Bos mutus TaxID=72004 RepID=A0A6B0QUK6_9CETA|nr:hypothetical protein [Bos mutus]